MQRNALLYDFGVRGCLLPFLSETIQLIVMRFFAIDLYDLKVDFVATRWVALQ